MARDATAQDEIADSVFVHAYIPKTLDDVKNAEEDVIRLTSGQNTEDMYYKTITGLKDALSSKRVDEPNPGGRDEQEEKGKPDEDSSTLVVNQDDVCSHSGSDSRDEESEFDGDDDGSSGSEKESRNDKKAARKENKKKVKEEKREARKNKIPKAIKKRKKKLSKAKKTR